MLSDDEMLRKTPGEPSCSVRDRVRRAREVQYARFSGSRIYCNAQMTSRHMKLWCRLSEDWETMLKQAIEHLRLSARAYDRILKVSRTIADLAGAESIGIDHIAEAVQYRSLDRKYWR
jgi:magnesium chelatase family protein